LTPWASREEQFRGCIPTAHVLAYLRFNRTVTAPAARLATDLRGYALVGRDSHPLGNKPNFAKSPHDFLLSDQQCLVATNDMQRDNRMPCWRIQPGALLSRRMARSFDHKIMRVVCQEYARLTPNAAGQLVTTTGEVIPQGVKDIASELVALQQARFQADYDTATGLPQAQAQTDVQRAESAFTNWGAVQADSAADTLLAELLCCGIPKR
jgi:hypothetical protein